MKTRHTFLRAGVVAASAILLSLSPALRAAEKAHEHAEMAKPGSAAAALESIHKLHGTLTTQVKGKQLKSVHETCEQLTAAANALPALSKDLPAEKAKRVDGSVKNLAKALDALHDAADDGNQAGSEKQLKTVDSLIAMISSQYGDMAKKSGHDH